MTTPPTPLPELAAASDSDIALAAEIGRRLADSRHITAEDICDDSLVARILTGNEKIVVTSFEQYGTHPRRPRGGATVHDPAAFVDLANRVTDDQHSSIYADHPAGRFTLVVNDHGAADLGGWRDHTVTLQLQTDPEWTAWVGANGKLIDQAAFAEFIEQYASSVVKPDAATMLEVARSFTAARDVQFAQAVNLTSSDVQLRYEETTTARAGQKGTLDVPREFTLLLTPYLGVEPVEMVARLRWRLRDGHLAIGYQLHRPDLVARDAYSRMAASIAVTASAPLYWGVAPDAVRAE